LISFSFALVAHRDIGDDHGGLLPDRDVLVVYVVYLRCRWWVMCGRSGWVVRWSWKVWVFVSWSFGDVVYLDLLYAGQ
jgi:hypothetical protein